MIQRKIQRLTAWSLLWLYAVMLTIAMLHTAIEAVERDAIAVVCQDCAHRVHHCGHLSATGHDACNCPICQSATASYLCPDVQSAPAPLTVACAVTPHYALVPHDAGADTRQSRAPPAGS